MIKTKICGISTPDAVRAAVEGGADYLGFVFYPRSPRFVDPLLAAELGAMAPGHVQRVGLFVDPDLDELLEITETAKLSMIQLHGDETPDFAQTVKSQSGLPVIKAVGIADRPDLDAARRYDGQVDYLMFDAKPDPSRGDNLPGGNARSFDWTLLADHGFTTPWFLAGGLTPDNVAEAINMSGASLVDVSSGVEAQRGVKDVRKIANFLSAARTA